jgi:ferredoxin
VSKVDDSICMGCGECIEHCPVHAIEATERNPVVHPEMCLGCGACVLTCLVDGGLVMELVRPPESIPKVGFGPSSILMDM